MVAGFNPPGVNDTEKPRNLTAPGFLMFGHNALPGSDFFIYGAPSCLLRIQEARYFIE